MEDRSTIRLTVDYDVDLARIRQLIKITPNGVNATMDELLMVIDQNESLNFTNTGIVRNQGYIASLNAESAKECI
jgi:spore coat polysaccharide biosynthesis protein SpsF (cytidylyltransferase family)